jgi:short-subunit dehydrogenase
VKAIIFGASGGLGMALAHQLIKEKWEVELVTREVRVKNLQQEFCTQVANGVVKISPVKTRYTEYVPKQQHDAIFFTQALFNPKALTEISDESIISEINTGLTDIILMTRRLLVDEKRNSKKKYDFAYIGSTSSYAGFKNTSTYCAIKHGLLGFVRAMNDEYTNTDCRFWLFSMGTMRTDMGMRVPGQDPCSFLDPVDVASRVVASISRPGNLFEPEVIMRRRTIKFL